jgi:peptidoglycan-N-acetylmuramic acid deacetylase
MLKNKALSVVLAFVMVIVSLISVRADNTPVHWYVKNNKEHKRPDLGSDLSVINNYRASYIGADEKVIYLTFDAGYENGNVAKILDVLDKHNVKAAFFVLENLVSRNTELVKRMADEGHLVCNHTKNHKNLSNSSSEEIIKNLTDLEKLYEEKTGKQLDKYFRFPEGNFSENSLKVICDMGYKTIFWSFAYDDWDNSRQPNCEAAKRKILTNTHSGAIILLHPTSNTNVAILPDLIASWRQMGYRFGTLYNLTK